MHGAEKAGHLPDLYEPGRTQDKDQKSRTCPAKSGRLVTLIVDDSANVRDV